VGGCNTRGDDVIVARAGESQQVGLMLDRRVRVAVKLLRSQRATKVAESAYVSCSLKRPVGGSKPQDLGVLVQSLSGTRHLSHALRLR
jgi:hypothetical protein